MRSTRQTAAAWATVGLVAIVVGVFAVVSGSGGTHHIMRTGSSITLTSTPTPPLPNAASTSFDVKPRFEPVATTVYGSESDPISHVLLARFAVKASQRGFTVRMQIRVAYTHKRMEEGQGGVDAVKLLHLEVANEGERYSELPLEVHLEEAGRVVSGYLTYPAVLPGSYESVAGNIGEVDTNDLGVSFGGLETAAVIFDEHKGLTDTVLVFGEIGQNGNTLPKSSCITGPFAAPPPPIISRPTHIHITERRGGVESYVLGTITFPAASAKVAGQYFVFNCEDPNQPSWTL